MKYVNWYVYIHVRFLTQTNEGGVADIMESSLLIFNADNEPHTRTHWRIQLEAASSNDESRTYDWCNIFTKHFHIENSYLNFFVVVVL